jgi:hypothetical protein
MAKRKKTRARSTSSRRSTLLNVEYDSLTFLLFVVFVLLATMLLVSKALGMNLF